MHDLEHAGFDLDEFLDVQSHLVVCLDASSDHDEKAWHDDEGVDEATQDGYCGHVVRNESQKHDEARYIHTTHQ